MVHLGRVVLGDEEKNIYRMTKARTDVHLLIKTLGNSKMERHSFSVCGGIARWQ